MAISKTIKNITLIIGSGRFGSAIANRLSNEEKNVSIVDKVKRNFDRLNDNFMGYKVVGDATELSTLEKAHIKEAKEIIVVTGDDNVNVFVSHVARKIYDVPSIFIRLDDPESERLIKGLKINAISPLDLCVAEFNKLNGGNK